MLVNATSDPDFAVAAAAAMAIRNACANQNARSSIAELPAAQALSGLLRKSLEADNDEACRCKKVDRYEHELTWY